VTILNWKDPIKYFFVLPNGIAGRQWVNGYYTKKIKNKVYAQKSELGYVKSVKTELVAVFLRPYFLPLAQTLK